MATRLKNILRFAAVPVGVPTLLPHNLNWQGRARIPDVVQGSREGFTVVADNTNVTVTNNTGAAADIDVLVETWHTIERDFGAVLMTDLVPQPFVVLSGDAAAPISIGDLDWKNSVRLASTANLGLAGLAAIDGVVPVAGDRILAKNQAVGADNGIYVAAAGAWARSSDADVSVEVTAGLAVVATEGATQTDTAWLLTTNDPIVLGVTPLAFAQFASTVPSGWTDDGAVVRLTTVTDQVVVGALTPLLDENFSIQSDKLAPIRVKSSHISGPRMHFLSSVTGDTLTDGVYVGIIGVKGFFVNHEDDGFRFSINGATPTWDIGTPGSGDIRPVGDNVVNIGTLGGPSPNTIVVSTRFVGPAGVLDGAGIPYSTFGDYDTGMLFPAANTVALATGNVIRATVDNATPLLLTQGVNTSGSASAFRVIGGAHTTLAASVEASDVIYSLSRIVQFATGAQVQLRAVRVEPPTYAFVGASVVDMAATFTITGQPVAGANATLTAKAALYVQAGYTRLAGRVVLGTPTAVLDDDSIWFSFTPTTNYTAAMTQIARWNFGSHSGLSASTESLDLNVISSLKTLATGALALQRWHLFQSPRIGFVAASTVTLAATIAIDGSPRVDANATLTKSAAILIQQSAAPTNPTNSEVVGFLCDAFTQTITVGVAQLRCNQILQQSVAAATPQTVTDAALLYVETPEDGFGAGPSTITQKWSVWATGRVRGSKFMADAGTAALPSLVPDRTDPDTGFYGLAANTIGASVGTNEIMRLEFSGGARKMNFFGTGAAVARSAAIADAAGGAVIDIEARAALNALLAYQRILGFVTP